MKAYAAVIGVFALLPFNGVCQPSLQPGIAQTQAALNQIDSLLLQNQNDLAKIFASSGLDVLKDLGGVKAVDALQKVYSQYELRKAIHSGDYARAIEKSAGTIADLWIALDPTISGQALKFGKTLIEQGGKIYEIQSLRSRQKQLLGLQHNLEMQLYRLEGKDPKDLDRSWWKDVFQDDAKLQQAFRDWLAKSKISQNQLAQEALAQGTIVSATAPGQLAKGMSPDQGVANQEQLARETFAPAAQGAEAAGVAPDRQNCRSEFNSCNKGCFSLPSVSDMHICSVECSIAEKVCMNEPVSLAMI